MKLSKEIEKIAEKIGKNKERFNFLYKAKNDKYYFDVIDGFYGQLSRDAVTHGPYNTEKEATKALIRIVGKDYDKGSIDISGTIPVPKKSPNGTSIIKP